jgi:hypothetical protein
MVYGSRDKDLPLIGIAQIYTPAENHIPKEKTTT